MSISSDHQSDGGTGWLLLALAGLAAAAIHCLGGNA